MNSKISCLLGIAIGSGASVVLTKAYFEKKYADLYEKEVASVKEIYEKTYGLTLREVEQVPESESTMAEIFEIAGEKQVSEISVNEYAAELRKNGYHADYTDYSKGENHEPKPSPVPYIIDADQAGSDSEYDYIPLVYFADGVLVDDGYSIIRNLGETVGTRFADYFGDDDVIYIRNEATHTDYEVRKDYQTYEDFIESRPYLVEDE